MSSISGIEFNKLYPTTQFIILVDESDEGINFKFTDENKYKIIDGINFKPEEYIPDNDRWFHFIDINKSYDHIKYKWGVNKHWRHIKIPYDATIYIKNNYYISNKILAYEKKNITELQQWNDYEYCKSAVSKCGILLEYVKNPSPELCLIAVKNYGNALKFINGQTLEMCLEAVNNTGCAIQHVTIDQTPEMAILAVKNDGHALEHVKEQTEEICLIAIENNYQALHRVKKQTEKICLSSVKKESRMIAAVKNQTDEIKWAALNGDRCHLNQIENPTYGMMKMAVQKSGLNILDIKEEDRTEELYILALKQYGGLLAFPGIVANNNMALAAIQQDGNSLRYINEQTKELCEEAIKQNGFALRYIKDIELSNELRDQAFDQVKNRYALWTEFIKKYTGSQLFTKSLDEQRKWMDNNYTLETQKQIMKDQKKLYKEIYWHICDFEYNDIKDIFFEKGIYYTEDAFSFAYQFNELVDDHYYLMKLMTFLDLKDIFDFITGNLLIMNLINKEMIDKFVSKEYKYIFSVLKLIDNNVVFDDYDSMIETDDHRITKKYINGVERIEYQKYQIH